MRTLLRHAPTGQYYQSLGKWTTDPRKAHDFKLIARAVSLVRKKNCANFEVDLRFDSHLGIASFRLQELLAGS